MTKARFDEMMKAWLYEQGITVDDIKSARLLLHIKKNPINRENAIETNAKQSDNKPKGTNVFMREEFKASHPFMPNEDYKEAGK